MMKKMFVFVALLLCIRSVDVDSIQLPPNIKQDEKKLMDLIDSTNPDYTGLAFTYLHGPIEGRTDSAKAREFYDGIKKYTTEVTAHNRQLEEKRRALGGEIKLKNLSWPSRPLTSAELALLHSLEMRSRSSGRPFVFEVEVGRNQAHANTNKNKEMVFS